MTQYGGTTISSLASMLQRRYLITGILREVLTAHFSQPNNIEAPELRQLLWNEGNDTGIVVESYSRWRPELTEKRPAIVIKPNRIANDRRAIGDRRQGQPIDRQGNSGFETFWVGSHTLFCLSRNGVQAEYLASEVQRELTEFSLELCKSIRLLRFSVTEIGEPGKLEEATENWVTPVTVGYGYAETWKVRQQAPRLKHVSLSHLIE